MTIEMLCPHCGHQLSIPDRMAGKKAGCIHCEGRFMVPEQPPVPVATTPGDTVSEKAPSSDMFVPRSLSALERLDIDGGGELSPVFQKAAEAEAAVAAFDAEGLGCLFWGLAFLLPPAALIWSFFLPKGHPQKGIGMGVSGGFLALAIVLFVLLG